MRLKSLFLGLCLGVFSTVHAANLHVHPQAKDVDNKASLSQKAEASLPCSIEIINDSNYSVHVSGIFDDNSPLGGFDVFPYEMPHQISLFYYGYCHAAMYLTIQSNVYPYMMLYQGQTPVGSSLRIYNGLANTAKVQTVRK